MAVLRTRFEATVCAVARTRGDRQTNVTPFVGRAERAASDAVECSMMRRTGAMVTPCRKRRNYRRMRSWPFGLGVIGSIRENRSVAGPIVNARQRRLCGNAKAWPNGGEEAASIQQRRCIAETTTWRRRSVSEGLGQVGWTGRERRAMSSNPELDCENGDVVPQPCA